MKASERLDLANKWASSIVQARLAELKARQARKRASLLCERFTLDKWPKHGLSVPTGIVLVESQRIDPSWRTIAEAYISPELIAEELAALPVVPRLVLVANQAS